MTIILNYLIYNIYSVYIVNELLLIEKHFLNINTQRTSELYYGFLNNPQNVESILLLSDFVFVIINTKRDFKNFITYCKSIENYNKNYFNFKKYIPSFVKYVSIILTIFIFISNSENKNLSSEQEKHIDANAFRNNIIENIEKFIIWNFIKKTTPDDFELNVLNKFVNSLCSELENMTILKRKTYTYKNDQKKIKSVSFIYSDYIIDTKWNLNISFSPFNICKIKNEVYAYSEHFTTLNKVLKPNSKSGKVFEFKQIETNLFNNLNNNWFQIDVHQLQQIFDKLLINNCIENLENEIILLENEKTTLFQKCSDINIISKVLSRLSKLLHLAKIKKIITIVNDNKIYLPYKFDFRGRLYYLSDVSPTHNKEFRYCMYQGFYNRNSYLKKYHYLIPKIEKCIEKHFDLLLIFQSKSSNMLSYWEKINIIWNLVSIAETQKSKLGDKISIQNLIICGLDIYNQINVNHNEVYDTIKINYHKLIIDEIISNEKMLKKRIISKDATASCFQHLIKILGEKTSESLTWCNMNSEDTWYDPYTFIIQSWKHERVNTLNINTNIWNQFNRSNLKHTIMTHSYGAGLKTCWKKFEIKCINYLSKEELVQCKVLFTEFYKYIEHNTSLTAESSIELVSQILNNLKQNGLNLDVIDGKNWLHYMETKSIQEQKMIDGKRYTHQKQVLLKTFDVKKIKTSARANFTHALDSALVRWFISKNDQMYTIHDCFLFSYENCSYVISVINEGMNINYHENIIPIKKNNNEIFSPFIII